MHIWHEGADRVRLISIETVKVASSQERPNRNSVGSLIATFTASIEIRVRQAGEIKFPMGVYILIRVQYADW